MNRSLWRCVALVSLFVAAVSVIVSGGGFGARVGFQLHYAGQRWKVKAEHGNLVVDNSPQQAFELHRLMECWDEEQRLARSYQDAQLASGDPHFLGLGTTYEVGYRYRQARARTDEALRVPRSPAVSHSLWIWVITFPTSVLPALFLAANLRRWQRLRNDLCLRCGYDLRATPSRCPECGYSVLPPRQRA